MIWLLASLAIVVMWLLVMIAWADSTPTDPAEVRARTDARGGVPRYGPWHVVAGHPPGCKLLAVGKRDRDGMRFYGLHIARRQFVAWRCPSRHEDC